MEKISETLKAMNLNIKGDVLLNSNINTYLSLHTPETSPLEFGGHDTLQKSLPEIGALNEIKTLIRNGKELIRYIYCYRNISVAIPMNLIEIKDDGQTKQYYENIHKVLEPKIEKITEIKDFVDKTSIFVADNCVQMFGTDFHSVEMQTKLVILIDTLMSISYLVGSKSSLINDFTRFKRENSLYVKKFQGQNHSEKINDLQRFFSSPNFAAETLQAKFNTLKNVENLLYNIMSFAWQLIEGGQFYRTEDRLSFLRYTFLPLCMDLNISARIVLTTCLNVGDINKIDWVDACDAEKYKLSSSIQSVKTRIIEYTIRFQSFLLKLAPLPPAIDQEKAKDYIPIATLLYNTLIEGMEILSDLQLKISLQICYKMENRISEEEFKKLEEQEAQNTNPDIKLEEEEKLRGDAKLFQRKVRYNFAPEDLNAMLEAINLLKE